MAPLPPWKQALMLRSQGMNKKYGLGGKTVSGGSRGRGAGGGKGTSATVGAGGTPTLPRLPSIDDVLGQMPGTVQAIAGSYDQAEKATQTYGHSVADWVNPILAGYGNANAAAQQDYQNRTDSIATGLGRQLPVPGVQTASGMGASNETPWMNVAAAAQGGAMGQASQGQAAFDALMSKTGFNNAAQGIIGNLAAHTMDLADQYKQKKIAYVAQVDEALRQAQNQASIAKADRDAQMFTALTNARYNLIPALVAAGVDIRGQDLDAYKAQLQADTTAAGNTSSLAGGGGSITVTGPTKPAPLTGYNDWVQSGTGPDGNPLWVAAPLPKKGAKGGGSGGGSGGGGSAAAKRLYDFAVNQWAGRVVSGGSGDPNNPGAVQPGQTGTPSGGERRVEGLRDLLKDGKDAKGNARKAAPPADVVQRLVQRLHAQGANRQQIMQIVPAVLNGYSYGQSYWKSWVKNYGSRYHITKA